MSIYLIGFLIVCCAVFDRLRGDQFDVVGRWAEQLMYGIAVALLSGLQDWRVLIVAGLWWAGCSIGWGGPLGAFLERDPANLHRLQWWQFGPLKDNAAYALAFRGLIWGVPLLAAGWLCSPRWYLVAILMPCVVLGAPWLARATDWREVAGSTWEQQEIYRGLFAGLLVAGVFYGA